MGGEAALLLQGALEGQEVLTLVLGWGVEEQEGQVERAVQKELWGQLEGGVRLIFLGSFAPAPASVVPAAFAVPHLEQKVHFVQDLWLQVQREPPEHAAWL